MTREEAINEIKSWDFLNEKESEAVRTLIPELRLRESEDERIRKALIQFLNDIKSISESGRTSWAVRKEDAEMCNGFLIYLEKQKDKNLIELTENVELGLDRALMIVKDAQGVLPSYQTDDGIYECEHAIETLENILKTVQ